MKTEVIECVLVSAARNARDVTVVPDAFVLVKKQPTPCSRRGLAIVVRQRGVMAMRHGAAAEYRRPSQVRRRI